MAGKAPLKIIWSTVAHMFKNKTSHDNTTSFNSSIQIVWDLNTLMFPTNWFEMCFKTACLRSSDPQKLLYALDRQHHNVPLVNCHVVLYDLVTEFCQSLNSYVVVIMEHCSHEAVLICVGDNRSMIVACSLSWDVFSCHCQGSDAPWRIQDCSHAQLSVLVRVPGAVKFSECCYADTLRFLPKSEVQRI
jgi:hypothetical protein